MMVIGITAILGLVSCRPEDADIKEAMEVKLNSVPYMSNVSAQVHDGVAIIAGVCNDSLCVANCENLARHVKGVKSVVSHLSKAAIPLQASIIYKPDDSLSASVSDVVKHFKSIQAEVNNGVISLDGEIKKIQLPKLMAKLNSLNPVMIDNNLAVK